MQNPHADAQNEQTNFDTQGSGSGFDLQRGNQNDFRYEYDNNHGSVNKPTKMIFGLFLFLGAATLIYGFFNLNANIKGPFVTVLNNQILNEQQEFQAIVEMQNADTDEDGLSDYDEEYVYGTSAYMKDSDSDGLSDADEIFAGEDPLCPIGADCRGLNEQADTTNVNQAEVELPPTDEGLTEEEMLNNLKNLSVEEVRKLLLDSGSITADELSQIDDATLMQIFNETLNSNE